MIYALCPFLPTPEPPRLVTPDPPPNACRGERCAIFIGQGDPKTGKPMRDPQTGQMIGNCAPVVQAIEAMRLRTFFEGAASVKVSTSSAEKGN